MSTYGLEVDGNIGQAQINSDSNLATFTAVQGPVAISTATTVGTDGFDVIFARPSSTSGTSTVYNRVNLFQSTNTGIPNNITQFKPSIAANIIRYRPMNNGATGSTVSLANTQGNYGLQVFDSAGGTIYDSRKVFAGVDIVANHSKGTKYDGDVLYTIPSGEALSDYYFCVYTAFWVYISSGFINVNVSYNGATFNYSTRQIKLAMNGIQNFANTGDMMIIKLKGG